MKAGVYHFAIDRGADDQRVFTKEDEETGEPIDLTGLGARCQFRTLAGAVGTTTSTTLLLELLNGAGVAVSDAAAGEVTLDLTVAQTLTLCPTNQKTQVSYEIELYDLATPTLVQKFLKGKLTIDPEGCR